MRVHLQRDMKQLRLDLLNLAVWVEEAIRESIRALSQRKPGLAKHVIAAERRIDEEENHIEEWCLKMLAVHQPVAIDLRRIVVGLKINAELERVADLAEHIAECSLRLAELPEIPIPVQLQDMAGLATTMIRHSLDAFFDFSADTAREACTLEDDVDQYCRDMVQQLIGEMQQSPALIEPGMTLFMAIQHLERIADHATNIAEDVIYLVEGTIIRHQQADSSFS